MSKYLKTQIVSLRGSRRQYTCYHSQTHTHTQHIRLCSRAKTRSWAIEKRVQFDLNLKFQKLASGAWTWPQVRDSIINTTSDPTHPTHATHFKISLHNKVVGNDKHVPTSLSYWNANLILVSRFEQLVAMKVWEKSCLKKRKFNN